MQDLTQIKKVLDSEMGIPLKQYLLRSLRELKNIENIQNTPNATDQAIEFKSQLKAYDKLADIFSTIVSIGSTNDEFEEDNEYSVE